MNQKLIIGIGGIARSGKDTLCNLLIPQFAKEGISAVRMALADELKSAIQPMILEKYGIDIFNCSPEEKELVRPDLVLYGKSLRQESGGQHWTAIVEEKMQSIEAQVVIVPDIRYDIFPEDEVYWVKNKNKGLLIHVSRYTEKLGEKIWVKPPNEDEEQNDPLVRLAADISLSWESKNLEELAIDFDGLLQTIVKLSIHELRNIKRRAINI